MTEEVRLTSEVDRLVEICQLYKCDCGKLGAQYIPVIYQIVVINLIQAGANYISNCQTVKRL